jgi:hypothetical protein
MCSIKETREAAGGYVLLGAMSLPQGHCRLTAMMMTVLTHSDPETRSAESTRQFVVWIHSKSVDIRIHTKCVASPITAV